MKFNILVKFIENSTYQRRHTIRLVLRDHKYLFYTNNILHY